MNQHLANEEADPSTASHPKTFEEKMALRAELEKGIERAPALTINGGTYHREN